MNLRGDGQPALARIGARRRPRRGEHLIGRLREFGRARSLGPDSILIGLAAIGVGSIALWLATGGSSAEAQNAVTGFAAPVIDLVAAVLIVNAARSTAFRRTRLAWLLIALGMSIYASGDGAWAWISIIQHSNPFPSVADVAYVAFYPIVAAALLLFPGPARARSEAVRLGVDSGIVLLGGGMVVWHGLFLPTLTAGEPNAISTILGLGYPVGDLVLLFAVATLAFRGSLGIARSARVALVGGLGLMFIADMAYGELTLAGAPPAHWVDVVYFLSSLSIALAGYLQARIGDPAEAEATNVGSRWLVILPYGGLAAGFGVLLAAANGSATTSVSSLLFGAVGLTILVLVRQELTNRENARLLADGVRRESEARYGSLQGQATDAVLLVDATGIIAYASPSVDRILGLERTAVLGKQVSRLAHANTAEQLDHLIADTAASLPVRPLEWSLWGADGRWRHLETVASNLLDDPTVGKIVLTTRDVREREVLTQQVTQAAFHDLLTVLPNRALFVNRVGQALTKAVRSLEPTGIMKLDLDGFRRLNDSLGHASGDLILQEVALRLSSAIRAADTAARLSSDEFAILLDGSGSAAEALEVTERVRSVLREPLLIGGTLYELTACIGVATTEQAGEGVDATSLMRDADVALSVARQRGHDQVSVFMPSMQRDLQTSFELETDLRTAIAKGELVLYYQPIRDLATRQLVSAEALVRWDHPTRGRVPPDVFIPIAEESGLIGEIGTWVLRTACAEVARWANRAPNRVPRVSVNLASAQVADPNLPWTVQSALARAGAAPGWLTLEITERQLVIDTAEVLERLHSIHALGVQISIDDFGTGYSSLAYLQQFPVSHIKIDRSFVTPLDDPEQGPGIAAAIVEIGRALEMSTIAEGIETEQQLERLRAMGCPLGQGYLLGRPVDAATMLELVGEVGAAPLAGAA